MVYDTNSKKFSGFTQYNTISLDDRSVGTKDGGNANFPIQAIIDKVAEVFGGSFRVYEFESELIASDIQLGEYALVEENDYRFYKVTNVAPTGNDLSLTSGYTAEYITTIISSAEYVDLNINGSDTNVETYLQSQTSDFESMAALGAASPDTDVVYVKSFYAGWAATTEGPKGSHLRYLDATDTGTPGTYADGVQYDAAGNGWKVACKDDGLYASSFGFLPSSTPSENAIAWADMILYCHLNNKKINIGKGVYEVSGSSLKVWGGDQYYENGTYISGEGVGNTIIRMTGTNADPTEGVIVVDKQPGSSFQTAWNVIIEDVEIDVVESNAWSGFVATRPTSRVTLRRFDVTGNAYNAIWQENPFVCVYEDCVLFAKNLGFYINLSGTTNSLNNIGVFNCDNAAFTIKGVYSSVGNIFAENCQGILFDFSFFSGSIESLGSEQPDTGRKPDSVLRLVSSSITIESMYHLNPAVLDSNASIIEHRSGSNLQLNYCRIAQNDGEGTTAQCALLDQFDGHCDLKIINSDVVFSPGGISRSNSASLRLSPKNSTGISYARGDRRPYIGAQQDLWDAGNGFLGDNGEVVHAIYQDAYAGINDGGNGGLISYAFSIPPDIGDWFMENRPDINNAAGYVCTVKGTNPLSSAASPIPLVLYGTTANRPTTGLYYGLQYYDTTLNQPIWWNTSWRDAAGVAV